jgi:hypothetical protein
VKKHCIATLLLLAFVAKSLVSYAQVVDRAPDFIEGDQIRIDKLDGVLDVKISTGDTTNDQIAIKAYFILPDSIKAYINHSDFKEVDQRIYRDYLFRSLRRIGRSNYKDAPYFLELFNHFFRIVKAIHEQKIYTALMVNPAMSVQLCGLYRYETEADSFLTFACKLYPDEILKQVTQFSDRLYSSHIIEVASAAAPITAKKYLIPNDPVYIALGQSNDTAAKVIMKINKNFGKKSNAFVLLDDLVTGKLTMVQADSIGAKSDLLLKRLIMIRSRKNPLGQYSLDKELEVQALKVVRTVNDLHNESDSIRFKPVSGYTAGQLYTLIVYSEEEIFTSTFNGFFRRFRERLGATNGSALIESMGDNRFRTFIKQCASYGKLDTFLLTMTSNDRKTLMYKFAAKLERNENSVSEAVEVADSYTSIRDTTIQSLLQKTIATELERVTLQNQPKGKAIYGLLASLFVNQSLFGNDWYQGIMNQYKLPPIDVMPAKTLLGPQGVSVWHMYFYDDEDGDISFNDFLRTFTDSCWSIKKYDTLYYKISSRDGSKVEIYANRPKAEYEGQAYLEHYFDSLGIQPQVLIHRGHSYYAYKTIEKTKPYTKLFVLGSCGGYHSLTGILDKSPEANIISSKQIGVYQVNNPILKELADNIRNGADVHWATLWARIDKRLKTDKMYDKFLDYIPPHRNLGAIFIRAYNRLILN